MKNIYILFLLLLITASACTKRFYAPALYQHDVSYLPKPASFDTAKSATYVSLGGGFHQAVDESNEVTFGEFTLSEAHTFKNVNLAYGAFGSLGAIDNSNYQNETKDPYSFKNKNFGIVGGRASFNFYTQRDNINFRFFGVEASYSKEFGDFATYRRQVTNVPDHYSITRTEMLTIGGTTEILWHSPFNKNTRHALRAFVGKTLGNFEQVKPETTPFTPNIPLYFSMSYFAQFKQFWGAAELTKNDLFFPGMRLKLGYKF